ncbi:unnamed protein product [Ceutorhynchus assimilis]|uniref:Gem-associated protein 2 n=1 Tax=Ceutorhynchus assimilis TaxID=467358 RepID=A0A9N9MVQ7_9CUCU|nr:unnamed protein product [Ceutorhynchus assimilis]
MDFMDTESSDEETVSQRKALDVQMPHDFDPNSIPQTGEEYLQHVIYERTKKCKTLVVANGDFSKFDKNRTIHLDKSSDVHKPLDKFIPTKEWLDNAIKDFTQLRNLIKNSSKDLPYENVTNLCIKKVENSPPVFSDITRYTQASKINMLHEITSHLDKFDSTTGISENLGTWIYGILILLEKPLTPDCCFKLREFAKKCASIRADLKDDIDASVAVPLNLYICIIARYFNQLDLAD